VQTFKVTAEWVKIIRKSEKMQTFLANEEIRWQFNLAKSPWWGGFYERKLYIKHWGNLTCHLRGWNKWYENPNDV
jgi:hypothetical protein